jgi:hypothetical protein
MGIASLCITSALLRPMLCKRMYLCCCSVQRKSLVRKLFQHKEPDCIKIMPAVHDGWNACLQTLEGHSDFVTSVAFSHNSTRLASASGDRTVKIWDASSGACLQTLVGHSSDVSSVAFSHDSTRLASASYEAPLRSGMRTAVRACRRSRAIAVLSFQWPSRTTRRGWRRRPATAPLRSGIRAAVRACRRSRAIAVLSFQWPSRMTLTGWRRRRGTAPSRSGMRAAARACRRSRAIAVSRTWWALKSSNLFVRVLTLAQMDSGVHLMLKSGCGSYQSIGPHASTCQENILV